jgi:starch synthase
LRDSVVDCTPENLKKRSASGFVFEPLDQHALLAACRRAVEAYRDKKIWKQLQKNGMGRDFSWESSARQYLQVYRGLVPA